MRLENLYSNFSTMSPEKQASYVADYRLRRAEDMSKPPTWPKIKKTKGKRKTVRKRQPPLTEEEKILQKLMGLKKKDVIAMRGMK